MPVLDCPNAQLIMQTILTEWISWYFANGRSRWFRNFYIPPLHMSGNTMKSFQNYK